MRDFSARRLSSWTRKRLYLSLASLKVVGALALSMGIGFVMMIRFQFSRGDRYAWWIILVMSLVALVPITVISFYIGGVAFTGMEYRHQHFGDVCCHGYFKRRI